ncbi:sigma-70 family RNA polymerase sigma factor [Aeromicrobium sp. CTD01-1L150]|uniref:sigma-70 family RNA polymerase sigma factor n=1 Tax=Aeromicrobium sp. CTD01-1L150 TaxID=3341830 RepID=UPI0035BEBAC7
MAPLVHVLDATLSWVRGPSYLPARELAIANSLLEASPVLRARPTSGGSPPPEDGSVETRMSALVDLARAGDAEAFGQLYEHYVSRVYRFAYARSGSRHLAEDFTSETFTRALRSITTFNWQGQDFGAWLTTIARNLIADYYKSSRQRRELVTEELPESTDRAAGPAAAVVEMLTSETLMAAVHALPAEQRDCLLMRFIQGMSVHQTALALERSEGATRQLQMRALRRLARVLDKEDLT